MPDRHVWTNSVFERILGTGLGAYFMVLPFDTEDGGTAWHGTWTVTIGDAFLTLAGILVIVALWTSRLVITHGTVIATNFFISRKWSAVNSTSPVASRSPSSGPTVHAPADSEPSTSNGGTGRGRHTKRGQPPPSPPS